MKQSYFKARVRTSDGSAFLTVPDTPVKAGTVLVIKTLAGNHDNIATTEAVRFRMTNGAGVVNVACVKPAITGDFAAWSGNLVVPEGWYVEGYYAAAANAEVMRLDISGELHDHASWRRG